MSKLPPKLRADILEVLKNDLDFADVLNCDKLPDKELIREIEYRAVIAREWWGWIKEHNMGIEPVKNDPHIAAMEIMDRLHEYYLLESEDDNVQNG